MTKFNDTTYLIVRNASLKYLIRTIFEQVGVIPIKVFHFVQKLSFVFGTLMNWQISRSKKIDIFSKQGIELRESKDTS
jgi:hypothetical protein